MTYVYLPICIPTYNTYLRVQEITVVWVIEFFATGLQIRIFFVKTVAIRQVILFFLVFLKMI